MKVHEVGMEEFFSEVYQLQFQNQDIKEAMDLGYKGVQEAYEASKLEWARFYLIKHRKKVLATILEQRDGNLVYFTTVDLPGQNMRRYVKVMDKLSSDVIKCRDVLFVTVISWYEEAKHFLRLAGFRRYHINNKYEVWYKDGQQD